MKYILIVLTLALFSFVPNKSILKPNATYKIAKLKYNGGGDWYSNKTSLPNLIEFCNENLRTQIAKDEEVVEVGSAELFSYPFVHMTGHGNVVFSSQEAQNLRNYLIGGGFLHIDDNYGMDKFVRLEMKKVFPELDFIELPYSHDVYSINYKFPDGLPKIHEHDGKPAQGFGLLYEGRLVCFYSYESDLGNGWEDSSIHNDPEEKRIKALKWIKIESVWGIGRGLQKRLKLKGCKTAFDFTQLSDDWVRKSFSITEWKLKKDLEGIPTLKLDEIKTKRAIATTRSFEYTYSDIDNIKERISTFATSCAEKLRKQESSCHMIIVMLSSDRHKKQLQQHRASKVVKLSYPTDSSLTICKHAVEAVSSIFKKGIKYKRAGVIVTGLVPTYNHQLHIFEHENPKHKPLMTAIDGINKKYKDYKIKLGNQDLERTWKMRQERLSPRYTTNIKEIITVK